MTLKELLPIVPEPLRDWYLKRKYEKQLKDWEKRGRGFPTPHVVKQLAIKSFQKKYNVDTLIETGTYLGDMVYAQRKLFRQIYSIELSEQLHRMAVNRFKKYKNSDILQGDSGIVLTSLVNKIKRQSIFWLDGHYSGGFTAKGDKECPIIQELGAILGSPYEHIILIDDAREFTGTNDYPTIEELESIIKKSRYVNSTINVKDDIIRIELKA